jgi:hypothetical protein
MPLASIDPASPAAALLLQANRRLDQGDGGGALELYGQVLKTDVGCAQAFVGAGLALEMLGDDMGALASYRHALSLDTTSAGALGALAALGAKRGETRTARLCAEHALRLDPDQTAAILALAQLELGEGQAAETAARLTAAIARKPLPPLLLAQAQRLRGDALDRLHRSGEALAAYAASARIFREQYAGRLGGPTALTGLDLCRCLDRQYRAADAGLWRPAPGDGFADSGATGHVFVVGFPRSGTTLLEQVLASHPQITALEERQTLTPAIDAYLDPPVNIPSLAEMDEPNAEHWRQVYWDRVRACGVDPAGKVFVDKQPFYTAWLPLIGKLFPAAKIVIVRRDPRDVVLSCFRRPFRMTPITYELMDLERSAHLYVAAMDILDQFVERSACASFAYRHEDLVEDFDATTTALCGFLGLDWTDRMRGFVDTAKARPIRTPSASQVVQGLNRQGIEVWRRYAADLQAILPILAPIAARFGYAP